MANSQNKSKLPLGGAAGEYLRKASSADLDTEWGKIQTFISAILGLYKVDANTVGGEPATGKIRYNNATQTSATEITINHITDAGIDIDLFLQQLSVGIPLVIQDKNLSDNYQIWEIASAPVHTGANYWTIPVTLNSSGGTGTTGFPNNHEIFVASFGGGSQGVTDHGALTGLGDDDHPQYTLTAEAQAIADAKVSDVAYDSTTWNGVADVAPSKNAVRDKIESLASEIAQKADLVSYSQYGGF